MAISRVIAWNGRETDPEAGRRGWRQGLRRQASELVMSRLDS